MSCAHTGQYTKCNAETAMQQHLLLCTQRLNVDEWESLNSSVAAHLGIHMLHGFHCMGSAREGDKPKSLLLATAILWNAGTPHHGCLAYELDELGFIHTEGQVPNDQSPLLNLQACTASYT